MTSLETILLIVITILPFIKRWIFKFAKPLYCSICIGIIMGLHLLIDGYRWQMIPAYLMALIVVWRIQTLNLQKPKRLSFLKILGFTSLLILATLAWSVPKILPVFSLPEPRGNYQVGTQDIQITTDRNEPITNDLTDKRSFMCKIWYPSDQDVSSKKSEPYVDEASREGFATKYGLPASALNYLDHIKTYVYKNIAVANKKFPVLIFSHGYGSKATGYYALLTEIASQGYIVVNMNHTYESLGTTYPDSSKAFFDYDFQRSISADAMSTIEPIAKAFRSNLSYEQRHPIVKKAIAHYFEGDIQNRWAEDIISVLDLLESWNAEGNFKDHLDLDKIGVLGHSVGGGTAGNVAMKDSRIKAAANLDGIQWGTMIDSTYQIPYLYISADWPADHEDINSHIYINKSHDYFYEAKLLNSGHPNFMDIPFMIPVPDLAGTGTIDPYLGMEIVTKTVLAFFDKHLKNQVDANPQDLANQYQLLEMQTFKGDSIR